MSYCLKIYRIGKNSLWTISLWHLQETFFAFAKKRFSCFDKTEIVKEYKEQIIALKKDKDATSKKLGETIVERDFVVEKLQCLVSCSANKNLVETEHKISQTKQLKLLGISKTAYFHKPVEKFNSNSDIELLQTIDTIHTKHPYYGTRRVSKLLDRLGIKAGRKLAVAIFASAKKFL